MALGERLQRVLQPVIDLPQHPRPQPHRQLQPGLLHRIAEPHPGRALVDLGVGVVAEHPQHLGLQPLVRGAPGADVDHLVLHQPAAGRVVEPQADDVLLHRGDMGEGLGHAARPVWGAGARAASSISWNRAAAASAS